MPSDKKSIRTNDCSGNRNTLNLIRRDASVLSLIHDSTESTRDSKSLSKVGTPWKKDPWVRHFLAAYVCQGTCIISPFCAAFFFFFFFFKGDPYLNCVRLDRYTARVECTELPVCLSLRGYIQNSCRNFPI